jgi:hypothetical protein
MAPGSIPSIVSYNTSAVKFYGYNASAVKIYDSTSRLECCENKKI